MTIETWLSFIAASMILCLTPGPTIFMVMAQALNHGRKSVLPLVAGVLTGDLIAMSLSLAGVGSLLAVSAGLFNLIKWLGAAYLIYLGIKAWRNRPAPAATTQEAAIAPGTQRSVYRQALIVTALNPKGLLFFVAFFPLFIRSEQALLKQLLTLGFTFLAVSAASVTLYGLCSGHLRNRFHSASFQRRFSQLSGGALVGAGVLTALQK